MVLHEYFAENFFSKIGFMFITPHDRTLLDQISTSNHQVGGKR